MPERRVVVDHMTLGVSDLPRSRAFYTAALAPLGFAESPHAAEGPHEALLGPGGRTDIALSTAYAAGTGVDVAFAADAPEDVDAFRAAALAAGGCDAGPLPRRTRCSAGCHGTVVLDPDGHRVGAVFHEHDASRRAQVAIVPTSMTKR